MATPDFAATTESITDLQNRLDNDGVIWLQHGTYGPYSTGLDLSGDQAIIGPGIGVATLEIDVTSGPAIDCQANSECNLQGFTLKSGNTYANIESGSHGIQCGSTSTHARVNIANVAVHGYDVGLYSECMVVGRAWNLLLKTCTTGLKTGSTSRSLQNLIAGLRIEDCGTAMDIDHAEAWTLLAPLIQNNRGGAMDLSPPTGKTVQNLYFLNPWVEDNHSDETTSIDAGSIKCDGNDTDSVRDVVFMGGYYKEKTSGGADYNFELGKNEGVHICGMPFGAAPTVKTPSSGYVRTFSPARAAAEFWARGSGGQFDSRHDADNNDSTPLGHPGDVLVLDYSSATTVNNLGNYAVRDGMVLTVIVKTSNITLKHNYNSGASKSMKLADDKDWTPAHPARLEFYLDGGLWIEMSRSWLGGGGTITGSLYP